MKSKTKCLLMVLLSLVFSGTFGFIGTLGNPINKDGDIDGSNNNGTGTKQECMVQQSLDLKPPESVKLLTYIRPSSFLKLTATFKDKDGDLYRDDIVFNNIEALQHKVRRDQSTPTRYQTNLAILDGWNYFDFSSKETSLEIIYQGISIVQLAFEFPVQSILMKGIISNCSAGHPSWNVDEGEQVEVALQPDVIRHNIQQLQIRGPLQSKPYIIHNDQHKITIKMFNTTATLFVNITMHLSLTFIDIRQELQLIANISQSVSSPLMLKLGSDKDKVTIVYTLPENNENNSDENKEKRSVTQPRDYTMIMIGIVIGFCTCLIIVGACVIWPSNSSFIKQLFKRKYTRVPNHLLSPNCRCGYCPEKVINGNSKCCHDIEQFKKVISSTSHRCITEHKGFQTWCVDKDALQASFFYEKNTAPKQEIHKRFRSAAYNQLTTWFLNETNIYVSDCVRNVIRQNYPEDDENNYEGLKMD